jgi:single-strand selective monofunctional uracil DNA glycosylase
MNKLSRIYHQLARDVDRLEFGDPVTHVYNPLVYAQKPHDVYLNRFGARRGQVVLVGMNPGPFGMAQTGVPFGDVVMVRDWLGIEAEVDTPPKPHPKRPIDGYRCRRREVSGTRVWTWAKERFGTPDRFFEHFFVVNYCPLVFVQATGKNHTPDKLKVEERNRLFQVCDRALAQVVDFFSADFVIGIGAFAEKRIQSAIDSDGVTTGRILHPSPASPIANRGWAAQAEAQLKGLGISAWT